MTASAHRPKTLVAALVLFASAAAHAGAYDPPPLGPFPDTAPTIPLHDFAAGHLGLIDGSFQRAYLVAAWRAIGGKPLDAVQARQLSLALADESGALDVDASGHQPWADALKRFGGHAAGTNGGWVDGTRRHSHQAANGNTVEFAYDNCNSEALHTAATTLAQRAAAHGDADHDPWVAEWVRGQLAVFENCSYGNKRLPAAPADAPVWLRQDRAYQAAAALFYAGDFAQARAGFAAIAADASSPWAPLAPYLVARSDLRLASLAPDDTVRQQALAQAEAEFRAVAKGSSPTLRRSAQALLRRVTIERDRRGALLRLQREVGDGSWGPEATRDLGDFLSLVRHPVWERAGVSEGLAGSDRPAAPSDGGLVDWLASMGQAGFAVPGADRYWSGTKPLSAADRARACGKLAQAGVHRDAWIMVCYLSSAAPSDIPPDVRRAAAAMPDTAPAWATVTYLELATRMAERAERETPMPGDETQALRERFDAALAKGDAVFGADGINALRVLRAPVSASALDLATASRTREIADPPRYAWHTEIARMAYDHLATAPIASSLLSSSVSVQVLAALGANTTAPAEVREAALFAAWTRAAVLKQDAVVASLTPALVALDPRAAKGVPEYVEAGEPVERQFLLAQLMIRDRRFSPTYGGLSSQGGGIYEAAWGCKYPAAPDTLAFLDPTEATTARAEYAALAQLPTANIYVGEAVLALAKKSPADARLPGALASVVASTRRACEGETPISKAAFKALHRLFPRSQEARDTKYFF